MVIKKREYFRIISHTLLHADWPHLIFNMLTLYFFGQYVEQALDMYFNNGIFLFILLYLSGGFVSSIPSILKHKNDHWYNSVGASGAVAAILFAGIFFDPKLGIYLFFIPIPIPGYLFGLAYLVYSHYMSKKSNDNVNHDAHLTGAIFGFLFPLLLKSQCESILTTEVIRNPAVSIEKITEYGYTMPLADSSNITAAVEPNLIPEYAETFNRSNQLSRIEYFKEGKITGICGIF